MIIAGIYRDVYRDDTGAEIPCESKIAGSWEGDTFYAAQFIDDRLEGCVQLSREEFSRKVTGVKEVL